MTRKLRLIALSLWRFHRRQTLVIGVSAVIAVTGVFVALGASSSGSRSCGDASALDSGVPSRAVLDRVWFSDLPEDERSSIDIWLWTSHGFGVHQQGSSFRATYDVFEFERSPTTLDIVFLQDGAEASVDFEVARCDSRPPFDLCLTLTDPPRGPTRYYGFSDEESYEGNAALAPFARAAVERAPH